MKALSYWNNYRLVYNFMLLGGEVLIRRLGVALLGVLFVTSGCVMVRPDSVSSLENLRIGEQYAKEKKYDEAILFLKKAQEADPKSALPPLHLASIYIDLNRQSEAFAELLRARIIMLDTAFQPTPSLLKIDDAEISYLTGRILDRSGKPREAVQFYKRSLSLVPNRLDYRIALFSANVRTGNLEDASQDLNQNPTLIAQHLLLGLSFLKMDNFTRATKEFKALLQLSSEFPTCNALLAIANIGMLDSRAALPKDIRNALIVEARELLGAASKELSLDHLLILYGLTRIRELEDNIDATVAGGYAAAIQAPFSIDRRLQSLADNSLLSEDIRAAASEFKRQLQKQATIAYDRTKVLVQPDDKKPEIIVDTQILINPTTYPFAVISGLVSDDSFVTSVQVNGQQAQVRRLLPEPGRASTGDRVEFVARVNLKIGENTILTEAIDATGKVGMTESRIVRQQPAYPFDPRHRWALYVSVSQYQDDSRFSRRRWVSKESPLLFERLSEGTTSNNIGKLLDVDATKENIISALKGLANLLPDEAEEVLVFLDTWVKKIPTSTDKARFFFIPYDGNADDLSGSSIEASEFLKMLQNIRAKRVVVLLQTSYAESLFADHPLVNQTGRGVFAATREVTVLPPDLTGQGASIFLAASLEAVDRAFWEIGRRDPSLWDVFALAQNEVIKRTRGRMEPVYFGDKGSAKSFLIAAATANTRLFESLTTLVLEGQISREAFLIGAGPLVRGGYQPSEVNVREVLREYFSKTVTARQFEQRLLLSPKVEQSEQRHAPPAEVVK